MNFDLSDEQVLLKEQASRLFQTSASPAVLRRILDDGSGWSRELWTQLASLGFLGAALPEAYGGLGMEALDLAMVIEEAGRSVAPVPIFASICLAADAILLAGDEGQKARYLPSLAAGETIGTFAHVEGAGPVLRPQMTTTARADTVSGVKFPVPYAEIADLIVVTFRTEDGASAIGVVATGDAGVEREFVPGMDELVRHGRVTFNEAPVDILCTGDAAERALTLLQDRSAIYAAFEQIGGAERCLHMARDYALQRNIFGRPLGSYQAIKHKLADMLCLIEVARSNAWFAAWALANDAAQVPVAAASARLSAIEAYDLASRENLQIHGGIGYTWEADCHFYYRRARVSALNLGSAQEWSDRLVAELAGRAQAA